jgi:gluconolactonase
VLAEISPGVPDGMAVDDEDFLWVSAADGVHCLSPDGKLLGRIRVPETVSNCAFGGPKRNRLFITATSSLYAIYLNRRGAS